MGRHNLLWDGMGWDRKICPMDKPANTIWSPFILNANMKKLQTIQNTALRIATAAHEIQPLNTFITKPGKNHMRRKIVSLKGFYYRV